MKYKLYACLALMLAMSLPLIFSACEKEPEKPVDETLNKLHGDPYRAVLVLTQGKLDGTTFKAETDEDKDHAHAAEGHHHDEPIAHRQVITFELHPEKGWSPAEGSAKAFYVLASTAAHPVNYHLDITYYDKNGDDITGGFIENKEDQRHQHFFIPKNVEALPSGKAEASDSDPSALFDYIYLDTTPWNKEGASVTGGENPIGFRGAFTFTKDRKRFTLNIDLLHARLSKFKNGVASPYYKPSNGQKASDHWDVKMQIPVVTLCSQEELESWTSAKGTSFDLLTSGEQRIIRALAEGLGLTVNQALKMYYQEEVEEVAKIELVLAAGHFHGGVKFHQDSDREGQRYMNAVQRITLVQVDKAWKPTAESAKAFYVKTGTEQVQSAYGLWIHYYDKNGNEITGDFVADGADTQHQHFFTAEDVKGMQVRNGALTDDEKKTERLFKYVYMDTNPWDGTLDGGAKLIGSKYTPAGGDTSSKAENFVSQNPVGFKGFFEFRTDRVAFDLRIRLMHAVPNKLTKGAPSPYHAPTKAQEAAAHWDVDYRIPVKAYYSLLEEQEIEVEAETTYDELTPSDKRKVDAIAEAYGIDKNEALAALVMLVEGEATHDPGGLWF